MCQHPVHYVQITNYVVYCVYIWAWYLSLWTHTIACLLLSTCDDIVLISNLLCQVWDNQTHNIVLAHQKNKHSRKPLPGDCHTSDGHIQCINNIKATVKEYFKPLGILSATQVYCEKNDLTTATIQFSNFLCFFLFLMYPFNVKKLFILTCFFTIEHQATPICTHLCINNLLAMKLGHLSLNWTQ